MDGSAKARRTRRDLLQVAAGHFAEKGYHGTSYAELVVSSGMSKGAFYFHFPSKRELALEVYRAKQGEVVEILAAAGRTAATPMGALFETLERRAALFHTDRSLRCLPRLSTDFSRDPELEDFVGDLHEGALRPLTALLEGARRSGELRPELEPAEVARTIFASLIGLDELSERESRGADLLERTGSYLRLMRFALTPDSSVTHGFGEDSP